VLNPHANAMRRPGFSGCGIFGKIIGVFWDKPVARRDTQKHPNTQTPKHKNTKTQKHKNTKTQKHQNPQTPKPPKHQLKKTRHRFPCTTNPCPVLLTRVQQFYAVFN
jgi:hypothetical protein